MKGMFSLSIIVPVYNTEKKLLDRCIKSIENQKFTNYEILIIDDGSTEELAAFLDEFPRNNKKIRLYHKKNGGVSSARNEGIRHAKGDYIMFVDADDFLFEGVFHYFENVVLKCTADIFVGKSIRLHASDNKICDGTGKTFLFKNNEQINFIKTTLFSPAEKLSEFGDLHSKYLVESVCAKFFKYELCVRCKFDENLKISEDTLLNLDILSEKDIAVCLMDKVIYCYWSNPNSVLHKFNPNMQAVLEETLSKFDERIKVEKDDVYESYLEWKMFKIQQLIENDFKSSKDFRLFREMKYIRKISSTLPWRIERKNCNLNRKNKIKYMLIRTGLIVAYMKIKYMDIVKGIKK